MYLLHVCTYLAAKSCLDTQASLHFSSLCHLTLAFMSISEPIRKMSVKTFFTKCDSDKDRERWRKGAAPAYRQTPIVSQAAGGP